MPEPFMLRATRIFQYALATAAFGFPAQPTHQPSRRFRIAGNGIENGAKLHLYIWTAKSGKAPNTSLTSPPSGSQSIKVVLPIYSTPFTVSPTDGRRIWETAVEIEPFELFQSMLGRNSKGVQDTLRDDLCTVWVAPMNAYVVCEQQAPPGFDPNGYNWVFVQIENPGLTPVNGSPPWQRLTIQ